jgi:hypothetical protein
MSMIKKTLFFGLSKITSEIKTMVEIQSTRATIADLALIRDISIQTFTETFARVTHTSI